MLKGGQRSKDGTTDPDGVFTLRGGNDFDFHGGGGKGHNFFGQTFGNAFKHGGTAGQDNVGVQIFTDIDVTFHDGLEQSIVDTGGFLTNERGLEQHFWATETFVTNGDDISVWQFVRFVIRDYWFFAVLFCATASNVY